MELHDIMWSNIVLTGGNTMFPGFAERLSQELYEQQPEASEVRLGNISLILSTKKLQ
jgi:actin-related protein